MKKISLLCGLLGFSLYTNIAYADKIYDGVIGFSCQFKTTLNFRQFLVAHPKDLGQMFLDEYKSEYYFSFTGEYNENPSKKLEFSFINDKQTVLDAALDPSGEPILATGLITSKINSNPFQLSLRVDLDKESIKKSKAGHYTVSASFDYTDSKYDGEIEGKCNFNGFPYSDTESEDDEPAGPRAVVIHTNEKNK